jgi:2-dehydro-3-deoxygluconokinase
MIDWNKVFKGVSWFHFSAISPALNENITNICMEALAAAAKKGITISVDLNYRSKLWQYGKQPVEVMPGLVKYCDVVMGNIWSANSLLGIRVDEQIHAKASKKAYLKHAAETAKAIMRKFPKCKTVANTFRFDGDTGIKYYAALFQSSHQYVSPEFYTGTMVDKVGSGDCFMAGLIYGLYQAIALQEVINFATAAGFGKLFEAGDATHQKVEHIRAKITESLKQP